MRLQCVRVLEAPVRLDEDVLKVRVESALGRVVETIVPATQQRETLIPLVSEEERDQDGTGLWGVVCRKEGELGFGNTVEEADDVAEVEVGHSGFDVAVERNDAQILSAHLFAHKEKG